MKRILIIGAGEAGQMVAAEVVSSPELNIEVVAFLDDDSALIGKKFEGIEVAGPTEILPEIATKENVHEVIIAIPSATGSVIRRLLRLIQKVGLPFKLIPGMRKIIKGEAHYHQLRSINLEDLLGRESVDLKKHQIQKLINNKRILITGGGGSIGSEIARHVATLNPKKLILLGRGENSIFDIEHSLKNQFPSSCIESVIVDIRDRTGLFAVFNKYRPEVIYHAAAHKHVPFMERFPREAYLNNIRGTQNVIDAALKVKASHMVMLSTDKAVSPSSIMGASKRLAEFLMLNAANNSNYTRFISVRFGNVLGSRGSVVPLFIKQIEEGGPVTVTDPQASRFFMTTKEASMLVIKASAFGSGGDIFILNMGESVEIIELARTLIHLAGYEPDVDIPIVFTGLRPGEKKHEELMTFNETQASEKNKFLTILRPSLPLDLDLNVFLDRVDHYASECREDDIAREIMGFLEKIENSH